MDHLSKQQLILLALLVSFVTSLATGIFTVSLMSQAPQGVVQTINQVVERIVTPQDAAVTSAPTVTMEDKTISASATVSDSIVKLRSLDSDKVIGLGLVVSKDGVIIADKSTLSELIGFDALFANGTHMPMTLIQSQNNGDIAFLAPTADAKISGQKIPPDTFMPISFSKTAKLGQAILVLSGADTPTLSRGIVTKTLLDHINPDGSQPALIDTDVSRSKIFLGSPVFNTDGEVIGINTKTVSKDSETAAFYPLIQLKGAVPKIR